MLAELRAVERQLSGISKSCDVALVAVADCAELIRVAVRVERLAAAIRLSSAARAASTPLVWGANGATSPADWLARQTGRSTGAASTDLKTAEMLAAMPEVAAPLASGALSVEQAAEVAAGAAAAPEKLQELLEVAGRESYKRLRERSRAIRLGARSEKELEGERYRRRAARLGTDDMGGFVLRAEGPSADRVRVDLVLGVVAEQFFHHDRSTGRRRTPEARLYDALLAKLGIAPTDPCPADGSSRPRLSQPTPSNSQSLPPKSGSVQSHSPGLPFDDYGPGLPLDDPPSEPTNASGTSGAGSGGGSSGAVGAQIGDGHVEVPPDLVAGEGKPGTGRFPRAVRVQHASILRGRLAPGDICDFGGEDPLTLEAVRDLLPGSRLSVIVTGAEGTVEGVARLGRRATRSGAWEWLQGGPLPTGPFLPSSGLDLVVQVEVATMPKGDDQKGSSFLSYVVCRQRSVAELVTSARGFGIHQLTALGWSQPLCQVAGCNHTAMVETDHRVGWVIDPVSDLSNADRLCVQHHRMKTHHGYHLEAGTGRRRLVPP